MNDMSISLCAFTCFVFLHPAVSLIPGSGSAKTWHPQPFHPSPLMPGSCFILCFSPRVLIPKALRLETACSSMNVWCSSLQSFRATDFFFKTLFTTFPFFSPSPFLMLPTCYSTTLEACCTLYLTKKRGKDWVSAIFIIAFLYFY